MMELNDFLQLKPGFRLQPIPDINEKAFCQWITEARRESGADHIDCVSEAGWIGGCQSHTLSVLFDG